MMVDRIYKTMKIMTCNAQTVTIIMDFIRMHFIINIWDSKLLYSYRKNKLTYLVFSEDCFNNE